MKNIIIIALILLILPACDKEYADHNVSYLITGLAKPYKVAYIDETGATVVTTITPVNDGEVWKYNFTGKEGDILYLFSEFKDVDLVPTKFKFRILIDGKVYKDSYGYDQSIGDTLFRVKRSGVIPY
jgi:hypothetical protein